MTLEITPTELAEAACCIWEEFLELKETTSRVKMAFEDYGTSEMRMKAVGLAEACHNDWVKAEQVDCFDWEFVPQWVADNVTF